MIKSQSGSLVGKLSPHVSEKNRMPIQSSCSFAQQIKVKQNTKQNARMKKVKYEWYKTMNYT